MKLLVYMRPIVGLSRKISKHAFKDENLCLLYLPKYDKNIFYNMQPNNKQIKKTCKQHHTEHYK